MYRHAWRDYWADRFQARGITGSREIAKNAYLYLRQWQGIERDFWVRSYVKHDQLVGSQSVVKGAFSTGLPASLT